MKNKIVLLGSLLLVSGVAPAQQALLNGLQALEAAEAIAGAQGNQAAAPAAQAVQGAAVTQGVSGAAQLLQGAQAIAGVQGVAQATNAPGGITNQLGAAVVQGVVQQGVQGVNPLNAAAGAATPAAGLQNAVEGQIELQAAEKALQLLQ